MSHSSRGINVWRTDSDPRPYRVVDGETQFSLFAAVHPIEDVPPSAEVVADIYDPSGRHYSYVLWFPQEESVVLPFDPNAAIQAFWREEYVPAASALLLPQRTPVALLHRKATSPRPREGLACGG